MPDVTTSSGLLSSTKVHVHGDSDATVRFDGSGRRTHEAIPGSELVVVQDAPHGFNVSHAEEFNRALLDFLAR